jgi:hypothetical protein
MLDRARGWILQWWRAADAVARGRAVETLAFETQELEHVFALLVLGVFVGIPAPPIHITTELLPVMAPEFTLLCDRVTTAHDPLGTLFSVLGID